MAEQQMKQMTLHIPLQNEAQAMLVSEILNVDKELKGSGINRNIHYEKNNLVLTLEGVDFKKLRVSANALFRNILLTLKTLNIFPQNAGAHTGSHSL